MTKIDLTQEELGAFGKWLAANGEAKPLREKELVRAKLPGGMAVLTKCTDGRFNLTPPGVEALKAFRAQPIVVGPKRARKTASRYTDLVVRDGEACFYCGTKLTQASATIEHLLARVHGGPDKIENLVLACAPCNKQAGNRPVAEKVRLRDHRRKVIHGG